MKRISLAVIGLLVLSGCGKGSQSGDGVENIYVDEKQVAMNGESQVPSFIQYENDLKTIDYQKEILSLTDLRYNTFIVTRNKDIKEMNYLPSPKGVRTIKLRGKKIVLSKNDPQGFYALVNKQHDLERLIIHTEYLEVNDQVEAYGTNVEIYAKEIKFTGVGQINTTPLSLEKSADSMKNGLHGLKAGNIKLVFNNLVQDTDLIRFVANGGNGQKAGPGKNGAIGHNASLKKSPNYFRIRRERCIREHYDRDHYDRMKSSRLWDCRWRGWETGRRSGNGHNAVAGGTPGNAGDAGTITSNHNLLENHVEFHGGKAGQKDIIRRGGAPGKPAKTCSLWQGDRSRNKVTDCATAIKGKDAGPKSAAKLEGQNGELRIVDSKQDWVTDSFISAHLQYTKDTYVAGNIHYTRNLINELKSILSHTTLKSMVSAQALKELSLMENKLAMNLDFFGNKKGWAPNLAFEVTYSLFEKEVKRNIKLLYLAYKIKQDAKKDSIKLQNIKDLQEEYRLLIQERVEKINRVIKDKVVSTELVYELKVAQDEFEFELKLIEQAIQEQARRNLEPRKRGFLEKAIKTFAAASKVIPVGQPALGTVGLGIDFLSKVQEGNMSATEIIKELPTVYGKFEKADFEKSLKDLNVKMNELSPARLPELRSTKDKMAYFKKVKDFTSPLYKAISEQVESMKTRRVSASKLNQEIERLKQKDGRFQKLSKKLNVLLFKKSQVVKSIESMMNQLAELNTAITSDSIVISYLYDDIAKLIIEDPEAIVEQMEKLFRNSLRKIELYDYILSKSFSYRFLGLSPVGKHLTVSIEKALTSLEEETDMLSALEMIWLSYEESLSEYVFEIIEIFQEDGATRQMSIDLVLSDKEVEALNSGKKIYINLADKEVFGPYKEDIRIQDIELIDDIKFKNTTGDFDLYITHLGQALMEKGGVNYYFDLSSNKKHWVWSSSFNSRSGHVYNDEPSANDETLLNQITGSYTNINQAFANPGARGFIELKLNKRQVGVDLKSIMLKIDYTYRNISK